MKTALLTILLSLCIWSVASAASITFDWTYDDPPTDMSHFALCQFAMGPDGEYTVIASPIDKEARTITVEADLVDDYNYFGLQAIDGEGHESGWVATSMNPGPTAPSDFTVKITIIVQ